MLGARFAGNDKIAVRKPEDIAVMPAGSMDVIVMHSVAQYLSPQEFDGAGQVFHRLLKPGGLLVLGDVIPRKAVGARRRAGAAPIRRAGGVFLGGAAGPVSHLFFRLPAAAQILGLARYDDDEIAAKLEAAGFSAERARTNIGHNSKRMTFLAHVR